MTLNKVEVAKLIKKGIMNSEYLPNERLIEHDLSVKYGVTRATIRLALADLENEQLIVKEPNRGAHVRAVSLEEAIEITEIRYVLEPFIAQKAAENINEKEITNLKNILKEMKKSYNDLDFERYSKINKELHNSIYEISKHFTAKRLLENLKAQSVRYQFRLSLMPSRINSSVIEHENIVNAVVAKDPTLAKKSMQEHINNMLHAYRNSDYVFKMHQ